MSLCEILELIVECRVGISSECNIGDSGCCELDHIVKNAKVRKKAILFVLSSIKDLRVKCNTSAYRTTLRVRWIRKLVDCRRERFSIWGRAMNRGYCFRRARLCTLSVWIEKLIISEVIIQDEAVEASLALTAMLQLTNCGHCQASRTDQSVEQEEKTSRHLDASGS
jgi:hypothetical protein